MDPSRRSRVESHPDSAKRTKKAINICVGFRSRTSVHADDMQSRYPLVTKWTAVEHEQLKIMAEAGERPGVIAKALGRSEAAVRVRAWQHGILLRRVTQKRVD